MNRARAIDALASGEVFDVLVIGGGATGLGAALDATTRGYRTALVEQHDFAKATSSRSTKLIHGGVRYLRQGNISLVRESLRERALLLRNAPDLSRVQSFVVPAYSQFDRAFYGIGLKAYDALAGKAGPGASTILSRDEAIRELPTVRAEKLVGGVRYFDGQFDDAALAIRIAAACAERGGFLANYVRVEQLVKEQGKVAGAIARDVESGRELRIRARVVINATGVFTDSVRKLDDVAASPMLTMSQGAHIVLDRSFLPGDSALMIPKTADGRVLFAIPWQDRVLVGTTDVPVKETALEPKPFASEIEFLVEHTGRYLTRAPTDSEILSTFAGLRPLVKSGPPRSTSTLSRDHTIVISTSGLVTITGGKWTTYRRMAEEVVTRAAEFAGLKPARSQTETLSLASSRKAADVTETIHPLLAHSAADVVYAVRNEMARTVEDFLSRRTRALLRDARAATEAAPAVAQIMAKELNRDAAWIQQQVSEFQQLAANYLWPRA
jgi:glycerol-3-phosphate dehydrogenase